MVDSVHGSLEAHDTMSPLSCLSSAADHDLPPLPFLVRKVVVVGDTETGKTCLVHTLFTEQTPSDYVATVYETYQVEPYQGPGELLLLSFLG